MRNSKSLKNKLILTRLLRKIPCSNDRVIGKMRNMKLKITIALLATFVLLAFLISKTSKVTRIPVQQLEMTAEQNNLQTWIASSIVSQPQCTSGNPPAKIRSKLIDVSDLPQVVAQY
jgi:hypothetical protein